MRQNALVRSAKFKVSPDVAIEEYRLPVGTDYARIVLKDKLLLQVRKVTRSGRVARYDKDFYAKTGTPSRIKLGRFPEMSYAAALAASEKVQKEGENKLAPKDALSSVFEDFLVFKGSGLKPATVSKKHKIFNSKLSAFKATPISKITLRDLQDVGRGILQKGTYSALEDYCHFANQLFDFAYARGYLQADIFRGDKLIEIFTLPKDRVKGYPYIKNENDLRALIQYISSYPHTGSVRNALKFAFVTALRSANVRNLSIKHIKVDINGEYYLHFPAKDMKIVENGDMYLGLPRKIGEWLEVKKKFANNKDGLLFSNMNGNALSDATLSKSLRSCVLKEVLPIKNPDDEPRHIVCHSLRIIMSTFANLERKKERNNLSWESIECVLDHAVGLKIIRDYDKSGTDEELQIELTRKVLTWWLEYIEEKGFRL
nr:tyrosine-type recombinase/integrase [uncultured Campylobacter sp.]